MPALVAGIRVLGDRQIFTVSSDVVRGLIRAYQNKSPGIAAGAFQSYQIKSD